MGVNIGGNTINPSGSGIALNTNFVFNSSGYGTVSGLPGYSGWKGGSDGWFSSTGSGWQINNVQWQNGLNTSNGVFTCPVAGYYACGFDGILNGGSNIPTGRNTYGYAAFLVNNAMNYWMHWNLATTNSWNNGGMCAIFSCAAGDTITLKINQSPVPASEAFYGGLNYGAYPENHHAVWCVLVG